MSEDSLIIHVLGSMAAGGNERLCLELMRHAPSGIRQALLTIDTPDGGLEELFRAIPGLTFFHVPYHPRGRLAFVLRVMRLFRRLRPTGILTYPFGLHLLISLAAKGVPGCRVLCHVGNPPPPAGPNRAMFRRIVRASRWLKTPLWSCSETVHEQLVALGGGMPTDSRPMPNGVDMASLRASAAAGRALRTDADPTLAMMARLDSIKDQETLVNAFALVLQTRPNARLWLVGDGERRGKLEAQVRTLGLTDAVSFLGMRKDVGRLLGQIDLFVFSTTAAEGFGIALAEAMAVGLPIVASDVPSCREVLDRGSCGWLVPPRDATAMAQKILALLADGDRASALGAAAAERCRARYEIGNCARSYYSRLLP